MIFEMGYRFDVLDKNVFSDDFLTRHVYPCRSKINKSVNLFSCRYFVSRRLFHLMNTLNRFQFIHVFAR